MDILKISLLGGLLGLDGTSVGQFMFSRPIVAGALVGWAVGDVAVGMTIGAVLELYLLVSFPVGGARFPEGSTATAVAVAVAAGFEGAGAIPLAVAVGLVWGQVGGATVTALRHLNSRVAPEPDTGSGAPAEVAFAHGVAISLDFLRAAAVTATGVWTGRLLLGFALDGWAVPTGAARGILLVGGAVSAGILLRDLGGFRKRRVAFAAGIALGILGSRFL